jgi:AcrR family transcriptional regulator
MSTLAKPRETTADRRAAIAAAARALIAEKGFEGLRTRDIADRVGINIATLHYHVPTKEALIQLVADSVRDAFIAQHRATPKEGMTGAERLHAEFVEFLDTFENHAELLDVMSEFDQRARRDPADKAVFERLRGKWLSIVVNILSFGMRDGSFRPDLDPAVAGAMIIATLTGVTRIPGTSAPLIRSITAELERSVRNPGKNSSPS